MTPSDDAEADAPTLSERLRRRFGAEIDPRIDLPVAATHVAREPSSTSGSRATSGAMRRMSERGLSASRYRMEGEIARGGMGAIIEVFDEDLRRNLAMKVILEGSPAAQAPAGGTVDPQKLARFLEEAQITGQLDHPGIVPVHELGLDAQGHVYFTMRLVRGRDMEAIFHLVETGEEGWTTTRALGVLLKVCEAMAFAHTKGVVHRDLKPANVMVGHFGEVYVMDWGLARVRGHADRHDLRVRNDALVAPAPIELDRRDESAAGAGSELYTMDGDVLGTPSYMPPEQALGQLERLDARSDVYALGAMLYRLLAGTAPHTSRGERVGAGTILERVVAGPPASIEGLAPEAPAELVAICEKAMQRDPARRYSDMLAVAEDLRAFLEGRVVGAFETGALAEARKWVRRNKPLAAALAAAVVALTGGLATSIAFARAANASAVLAETRRVQADENASAAQRQARIASEVNRFLNKDLLASVAPEEQGIDVSVREVLEQASTRLEGRFTDEPMIEAALRMTIGTAFEALGLYEPARVNLERALDLGRAHGGERADETIEAEVAVADVWLDLGRLDAALSLFEQAFETSTAVHGVEDPRTLAAQHAWGNSLRRAGRMDEARALLEATREACARVLGADHAETLATRNDLALLELAQGHFEEARREFAEILERLRVSVGPRHPSTLNALSNLASIEADAGDFSAAVEHAREAVALRREILGPDHPDTGQELSNLGTYVFRLGRAEEALELFTDALRILRLRHAEDHPLTLRTLGNLSVVYASLGRAAESLPLDQAVLEGRRRVLGPKHADTLDAMNSVATTTMRLGRLEESEAMYREALALQREVLGPDHPATLATLENLANVLFQRGGYAASRTLLREVLAARKRVLGDAHPDVAKTTFNLAMVTQVSGDTTGAVALLEEALERSRAAGPDGNQTTMLCLQTLGGIHGDAKEHEEAIAAYEEALEIGRGLDADDLDADLLCQLGRSKSALGDFDGALTDYQEALALRERVLGPDDADTRAALYGVADTLVSLERFAEAEPIALDFHGRTLQADGSTPERTAPARALLAAIYEGLSRPDEAAKWR